MPARWTEQDIADAIAEANAYLKARKAKVSIVRRGDKLSYLATLPPKPDSSRPRAHQQKIASGLACSKKGIRIASSRAALLGDALATGEFRWEDWGWEPRGRQAGRLVAEFTKDYRSKNELQDRSWRDNWDKYLRRLPPDAELTKDEIVAAILTTKEGSAARRRCCLAMRHLAAYAKIELDLSPYQGSYSRAQVKKRELPSDEVLELWCGADSPISNLRWRRLLGLITAYGLRPHEAFFGELVKVEKPEPLWVYKVQRGKTDGRDVYPFHPHWPELWGLPDSELLPKIDYERAYERNDIGRRVNNQFKRYAIPFGPYDPRHAYAIRMNQYGLADTVAAKLMGHTKEVHNRVYQRWLDDDRMADAIGRAISNRSSE